MDPLLFSSFIDRIYTVLNGLLFFY
jgi:hypothetical protein